MCTGNICRSPMAEALLRLQLEPVDPGVAVGSAGTIAAPQPASGGAVTVMAERGIDISSHRSRRLTRALVQQADLIIGMTREHVREASILTPDAWDRSFTLKEFVRRAATTGPRPPDDSLDTWLAALSAGRVRAGLLGEDPADDVADPMGLSVSDYRSTASELDELIRQLVAAAWPLTRAARP